MEYFIPWPVAIMSQYLNLCAALLFLFTWGQQVFVLVQVHKVCTFEFQFEVLSSVKHQVLPGFWVETSSLMIMFSPAEGSLKNKPQALILAENHQMDHSLQNLAIVFFCQNQQHYFTDMHITGDILLQLKLKYSCFFRSCFLDSAVQSYKAVAVFGYNT